MSICQYANMAMWQFRKKELSQLWEEDSDMDLLSKSPVRTGQVSPRF